MILRRERYIKGGRAFITASLSLIEEEMLFKVIERYEDLALFKIALNTGIRRGDIINIEVSNIDIQNRTLTFWEEKKNGNHTVPISVSIIPDITMYLNSIPKGQKRLFDISSKTAYNRLQYYIKKAGITKRLAFHDLRRTFVKNAKKKGLSIKAVAQILNDKYDTVEQSYANMDMEELKEEVDKL